MELGDSPALIRRKILAHAPPPPPATGPLPLLFTSFARVAERRFALPLKLVASSLADRTTAEIVETLPEQALMLTLDGPQGGLGLAILDQGAFAALGEVLALGALSPHPPPARRPTRTDAILIADVLDAILTDFDAQGADQPDRTWTSGFRYSAHLADPRPLALMLEEPAYRAMKLDTAFGTEGRQGTFLFILPARGRAAAPPLAAPEATGQTADDPAQWQADLAATLGAAETDLTAVFARVSLPLAQILGMEAGQSLVLPAESLDRIQIEGAGGRLVCLAHLGQMNGLRAVRLQMDAVEGLPAYAPPVVPSLLVAASDQPLQRPPAPAERHGQAAPVARESPVDAAFEGARGPETQTAAEAAAMPLAQSA